MYTPINWKDEVVEFPRRYTEKANGDGTVEHTPSPGRTLQEGTAQSATNFNKMEAGIIGALELSNENSRMIASIQNRLAGIIGRTLQVKLTNSQAYPFNSSGSTVQLSPPLNLKDYTIAPEVVSVTGGALGDVEFYDKMLNGFKVRFTGSAKNVTLNLYVRGGV